MTEAALEARGLVKRYGPREVLRGVDLVLPQGQWTAVVGANGAGKTTLLRLLAGLLRPDAGEVRLRGRALARWPRPARARELAWLAQGSDASHDFTVADCVALGRLPYTGWWGRDGIDDRRAIERALAATGAQAWSARRMNTLSGGERQRVLLARALAVQAPVLVLDEPTTFLDPPHQQEVARLLRGLACDQGVTVVSVVHDLSLALAADHLAVLGDGRLVGAGTPRQALDGDWLTQAFGQRIEVVEHRGQPLWRPQLDPAPADPRPEPNPDRR
ncbi:MAG: ABC transporter ATP-binding protein [Burkholderiales bacterium]|nr:ABC transporter ATP-binding protein [Burkholderiales bacterium]MDE1927805.1 ABC transporter ATP-binding protein [Burkholderiales bacterium]